MLHLEVLTEDSSGKVMIEKILSRALPVEVTFKVHAYKGVGHIPKNLRPDGDPKHRILLAQLPRLLSGYGRAFRDDDERYHRVVIVICDTDDKDVDEFQAELQDLVESCTPQPTTLICLATEEGEAWLLSDRNAVIQAYPKADRLELGKYIPDSVVGTWERLADVVYPGGHRSLIKRGFHEIGSAKHEWAELITPHLELSEPRSPSFATFLSDLKSLEPLWET